MMTQARKPEILAPAGDPNSFLAALAAGADAVYCGLKHFSARMLAKNFSISELAGLAELARQKGARTYVAVNTLIKPDEPAKAGRLITRLADTVRPEALIIQDLGAALLARQAGFGGELHLSTLANLSSPSGLRALGTLGVSRVVTPRELSLDEIKAMDAALPEGVSLEVFVHGALCHNVSGRCWWSSFLGGKSGLRGRCVQPCRRVYEHQGQSGRFFSCLDLSLDVLAKTLLPVKGVSAWKIEGRKKGPHYVFYATSAYKLLRDAPDDPLSKKMAQDYLDQALGRPGTNYNYLAQRPKNPVDHRDRTGSGLPAGKISREPSGGFRLSARIDLLPGDLVRVGFEDDPGHAVIRVTRSVPKGGRLSLSFPPDKRPESGAQVILIDRREKELMARVEGLGRELEALSPVEKEAPDFAPRLPAPRKTDTRARPAFVEVWRHPDMSREKGPLGVFVTTKRAHNLPLGRASSVWWWMPPVIWPDEEHEFQSLVDTLLSRGAKTFVLGAPWQMGLFPDPKAITAWAGPFCNLTNALALAACRDMGMSGAVVSPEMSLEDTLALGRQSPLPLGIVERGSWPLGVSRVLSPEVKTCQPFTSPKGEVGWAVKYDQNVWIYPNWTLDIFKYQSVLRKAGYEVFFTLREPMPRDIDHRERTSVFNFEVGLL